VVLCEKRLREKINRLHEMEKLEEESINSSATFSNSSSSFLPINYLFSLRLLIFLNAKNQPKKSEISADNQRIGCF
jgi:hypothetical protein